MIRPILIYDAPGICKIYNYYIANSLISFETKPVSVAEMEQRILDVIENYPWLVYEEENEILGYAYAIKWKPRYAYKQSVEVTVYLKHDKRKKGIGTKLYEALIEKLKAQNMHTLIGGIALPNDASIALHEKLGFEKVAHFKQVGYKFGKWIDVAYWERILNSK